MKVSVADVSEQFDLLLADERPREAVEAWAAVRMRALDEGQLEFDPAADEARIWGGIQYLLGAGLQAAPGHYLHGREDFLTFRQRADL